MIEKMPDLPPKRGRTLPAHRTDSEVARDEWMANRGKSSTPVALKPRTTPKSTWEQRKADAAQKVKRVQSSPVKRAAKTLPPLQGGYKESQHPRDRFGRFVVKA